MTLAFHAPYAFYCREGEEFLVITLDNEISIDTILCADGKEGKKSISLVDTATGDEATETDIIRMFQHAINPLLNQRPDSTAFEEVLR